MQILHRAQEMLVLVFVRATEELMRRIKLAWSKVDEIPVELFIDREGRQARAPVAP